MPIKFIKERKKQRYLMIIFLLIIIITFIVIWQGFFKKGKSPLVIAPTPPREVKINFSLLEATSLKELKAFEKVPPFGKTIGRPNPFLSY